MMELREKLLNNDQVIPENYQLIDENQKTASLDKLKKIKDGRSYKVLGEYQKSYKQSRICLAIVTLLKTIFTLGQASYLKSDWYTICTGRKRIKFYRELEVRNRQGLSASAKEEIASDARQAAENFVKLFKTPSNASSSVSDKKKSVQLK